MKILVVDDNAALAETLSIMLELLGHGVTKAHTAADAINQAAQVGPDVVLIDIGLPDMDGNEVCRVIRAFSGFAQPVCIAQSGRDGMEDKANAMAAGFDHYLVKPTRFETLEQLLATIAAEFPAVAAGAPKA